MLRSSPTVVFLDLRGGVSRTSGLAEALERLGSGVRGGAVCASRAAAEELRGRVEDEGHFDVVDSELIVAADALPVAFPSLRAFRILAVLADAKPEDCLLVSSDIAMLVGAGAAGFRTVTQQHSSGEPVAPEAVAERARLAPTLLAAGGEPPAAALPAAAGPTVALRGRVVTLNGSSRVHDDGFVVVEAGTIVHVGSANGGLPERCADVPEVRTGGSIYPGLIDLHNHFVYNVLPLWPIDQQYDNRTQWPRADRYKAEVSLPIRVLASFSDTSRAVVRFIEGRAIVGGTTTGQGILTRIRGSRSLFKGAMRNVETPTDPRLPAAGTKVPDLGGRSQDIEAFRRNLERRKAYFYHLGEGVDDYARDKYLDLEDNELVQPSLVGIHALGLHPEDLDVMAEQGAKIVWSPFSNLLLYGRTLDLKAVLASGVDFSLGCDWGPTGSVNLLQELKVARFEADSQGVDLPDRELVRLVTSAAAKVASWDRALGSIKRGALADLLVVRGTDGDPYEHLIAATEDQVDLVMVGGTARFGEPELMRTLHPTEAAALEGVRIRGASKSFYLKAADSGLDDVPFAAAVETLEEAMGDLPQFKKDMEEATGRLLAMGGSPVEEFLIELDNELEMITDDAALAGELMANWDLLTEAVDLLPPAVEGDNYLSRIDAQTNISQELKDHLKGFYV